MTAVVLSAKLGDLDSLTGSEVVIAQNVVFAVIGLAMVAAALRMVTTANVVHAALYLVIILSGAAGLFILLGAEFVAVTQILVYIGAIVVLFLFGIMLTRGSYGTDEDTGQERHKMAALVGVLVLGVTAGSLIDTFRDAELARSAPSSTAEIGDSIFGQYIVPFEAISVLLLAALIGSVVVARRD
ncbi:MAG: NADH-quinone oxidoreductase subunit J [Actinomycetota bacterium]|nr:NADH-quinone oxidoreductase subunit J [Actinomycetota bacterium]